MIKRGRIGWMATGGVMLIAACGGNGGGTGPGDDGNPDGTVDAATEGALDPAPEGTSPFVVSVTPPDGASGVAGDIVVTVTFSEPMDPRSTGGAWTSTGDGFGPADVTFAWSGGGKVLKVTPQVPLVYAGGDDPATTIARSYAFGIGTGATDLAGRALVPFAAGFSTLRHIVQTLPGDPAQDGSVAGGVVGNGVLDFSVTATGEGFLGFGLAGLPDALDAARIVAATLRVNSEYPVTFTTESVSVEQVQYGPTLVDSASGAAPLSSDGVLAEDPGAGAGWKRADVTTAVRADWTDRAARGDRTQYRLACGSCTVVFYASEAAATAGSASQSAPRLAVDYVLP